MKKEWQTKRIDEIAQHSLGKMLDKAKNRGELKPYLRNLNVRWGEFDLSDLLEMRFLSEEAEKYTAVKGDVLVCEGGYPGRAAIWDREESIHFQKALHRVRFHESGRNKWFVYYLQLCDLEGTLRKHFNGVGIQHFTGEALAQFDIPLPPLFEQHRIVGILDDAFDGLARASANAEQNLRNARALFESHLQSVFSEAWRESEVVSLTELASDITDGDHLPPPKASAGIPFITIGNIVKSSRQIDFSDTYKVSRDYFGSLKPNRRPQRGDVLYTVTGSFGVPVLVDDGQEFCFQRHIGLIRPKSNVNSRWLSYLMLAPQVFAQADAAATGAAQRTVSLKALRSFLVPSMPLTQQEKMAAQLDALAAETQRLESIYQQKLAALGELKKSLLHQAFSGKL